MLQWSFVASDWDNPESQQAGELVNNHQWQVSLFVKFYITFVVNFNTIHMLLLYSRTFTYYYYIAEHLDLSQTDSTTHVVLRKHFFKVLDMFLNFSRTRVHNLEEIFPI